MADHSHALPPHLGPGRVARDRGEARRGPDDHGPQAPAGGARPRGPAGHGRRLVGALHGLPGRHRLDHLRRRRRRHLPGHAGRPGQRRPVRLRGAEPGALQDRHHVHLARRPGPQHQAPAPDPALDPSPRPPRLPDAAAGGDGQAEPGGLRHEQVHLLHVPGPGPRNLQGHEHQRGEPRGSAVVPAPRGRDALPSEVWRHAHPALEGDHAEHMRPVQRHKDSVWSIRGI
mmetsp:Transcript_105693/g.256750  ORF Transcript_105693/g.256750 Transcript_105693/m.256750 type:complete len:229 (+) Transcript_105693:1148-1834(+)